MSYRPDHPPRLAGSTEAGLLACRDGERITLFSLPALTPWGEVALGVAADVEVNLGFVKNRLLVAASHPDRTKLHLVEPRHLRVLATQEIAGNARLVVCVGPYALFADRAGATLITVDDDHLTSAAMTIRSAPSHGAPFANCRAVLNVGGHIETWDLQTRRPLHRVKSDRPVTVHLLGGTAQVIWFVPAARASHVEVLPLAGRGGTWTRPVDGPVIAAAGTSDLDAMALASANEAPALLSLTDRDAPIVTLAQPPAEVLWLGGGPNPLLVTAARGQPLRAWAVKNQGSLFSVAAGAITDAAEAVPPPAPEPTEPVRVAEAPRPAPPPSAEPSISDRLKEWRDRLRPAPSVARAATTATRSTGAWRTLLSAWGRSQRERVTSEPPPWDDDSSLAQASTRAGLSIGAARGLATLYAAHLDGQEGVARSDLSRAIADDTAWDEALGRGSLARDGFATWSARWVTIVPEVAAAIDELPPLHARLIPGPEGSNLTLAGPCAVVVASPDEMHQVAERAAAVLGATIAVIELVDDRTPLPVRMLEARLRGVVPLVTAPARLADGWLDELGVALVAVSADQVERVALPMLFDEPGLRTAAPG